MELSRGYCDFCLFHCILYQFKGTELIRLEELPTCF